jgi:hypothetical protein
MSPSSPAERIEPIDRSRREGGEIKAAEKVDYDQQHKA